MRAGFGEIRNRPSLVPGRASACAERGPNFVDPPRGGPHRDAPLLMIETRSVFRRRRFHRAKAHLILSAMRHRAAELGDRVRYVKADTYRQGLREAVGDTEATVHHPTSHAAHGFVSALRRFMEHRLVTFDAHEDAVLCGDATMSHSLLSSSLNLGLLDPAECVERAQARWRSGDVPLNSAEGFVRQIAGWREFVWHLYWYFGTGYRESNALRHHEPLPDWFRPDERPLPPLPVQAVRAGR